jgi:hypothetical protein
VLNRFPGAEIVAVRTPEDAAAVDPVAAPPSDDDTMFAGDDRADEA